MADMTHGKKRKERGVKPAVKIMKMKRGCQNSGILYPV